MRSLPWALALLAAAGSVRAADHPLTWTDEVVVTATRFKDRYIDKPVNVSIITAEDIRASAARTVPDLLVEQAGINLHDFFGNNAATTTVDLRGFGITGGQNTLILVDGRRVNDVDLSGVQWSAIPLGAIERIEIVRGSGAVLYGDGATGGVVNIITRGPSATGNEGTVQMRAGSYDTRDLQVSAQHFSGTTRLRFYGSNFESDGYRANNRNRQSNALADVRFLDEHGDVTLKLSNDNQGIRLPGARRVQPSAGIDQLASDRRGTSTPLDYAQREGNRATLDWRRDTRYGEFNIGGGWRDKSQTSYFDFGGFPDYRVIDLSVWSLTPRVKFAQPWLGRENTLVAGVDWYAWDYRLRRSNSTTNIARPFNVVTATQETLGVYVQDTWRATDKLTLTAGLRREQLRIDANDAYDPAAPGGAFGSGAPGGSQRENEYAYELGGRYELVPGRALMARTGRSYRFANVDEIYETSPAFTNQFQFLRPQTAHSHELGVEQRRGPGLLRASLFQIDVDNEIHLDAYSTGIGNTNLPPSRRRGFEFEMRHPVGYALTAGLAYTYTDARFKEGVLPGGPFTPTNVVIANKTVPLVPEHKATLRATWTMSEATRLNAVMTYVGTQYMDNDEGNTLGVRIPAYTVTDLKLVHRRGPWSVSAAINNLFNEKYYNYAVRSQFIPDAYNAYPLPERTIYAAVEYALR